MTHDEAFLASILEAPDDDVPRLIYADWLDDHGDSARAEFIRLQIELARLPEKSPSRRKLAWREDDLLAEHAEQWTAPLQAVFLEDVATAVFHRGFVEEMIFWGRAGGEAFVVHADELFRLAPLRALRLYPVGGHVRNPNPWDTIRRTEIDRLQFSDLQGLLWMSHLERVRLLDLSGSTMTNPDGGPDVVVNNGIGDAATFLLADSLFLKGLDTLLLRDNLIGDPGAKALLDSPSLVGLTTLDLAHNRLSDAMKQELRRHLGERLVLE